MKAIFKPFSTIYASQTSKLLGDLVTESKIKSFSRMGSGWCHGRGVPFSDDVIADAIKINDRINSLGFYETDAFPGESGEVMVTIYRDNYYCEVIVYENEIYDFVVDLDDQEIEREENVNFETLAQLLKKFRDDAVCVSSGRFIASTGIERESDTIVWLSGIQVGLEGFQSLRKTVSSNLQEIYADTSEGTTPQLPVTRSFSGNLTPVRYQ